MAEEAAGSVLVKQNCVQILQNNYDKIFALFPVKLNIRENQDGVPDGFLYVDVNAELSSNEWPNKPDFLNRLQSYVDDICKESETTAAEDSSYDSDYDGDDKHTTSKSYHHDVSRTVSDTLGAEFAEYVSYNSSTSTPGYHSRVEFALKLGYTERLVQAALVKLGPDPGQNELLAELIKLGAQGPKLSEQALDGIEGAELNPDVGIESSGCMLRPVVIDGSNVAMSHGNKEVFSCRGIKLCVDWFVSRGHTEITVFVPKWRKEAPRPDNPITDQDILSELERDRYLVFTPSRLVGGKRMVCYDDRYILRLAADNEGIVVSNDNYRDLAQENPEFKKVVEERILMFSFVNDRFMPPDDPLGRTGPTLDNFLRIQPRKGDPPRPCPYGKKCTYGNKCKYHHPERGPLPHKSVTERLSEHAQRHLQARGDPSPLKGKSLSLPLSCDDGKVRKTPLSRTKSGVPASKTSDQQHMASVPKSHSVENVAGPGQNLLRSRGGLVAEQEDGTANLHRKLQRQLTLNPACDPRLYQMRRGYVSGGGSHRPLTRHSSNAEGQNQYALQLQMQQQQQQSNNVSSQAAWDPHQSVTRIASAPDSFRPWPPGPPPMHRHMQRLSSTSDPQINLCVTAAAPGGWQPVLWPPQAQPTATPSVAYEDARHKMLYHLSAIFPEEQVHQVMQLYPEETNPQKICAAILAMFPKDSLG